MRDSADVDMQRCVFIFVLIPRLRMLGRGERVREFPFY